MLSPIFENRFKKDIKRLQKRGKNLEKLKTVIEKLLENQELEPKYKDEDYSAIASINKNDLILIAYCNMVNKTEIFAILNSKAAID